MSAHQKFKVNPRFSFATSFKNVKRLIIKQKWFQTQMKIKRPLFSSTRLLAWDCERPNGRFYVQSRAHAWHKTGIECSQASAPRRWPFKKQQQRRKVVVALKEPIQNRLYPKHCFEPLEVGLGLIFGHPCLLPK